MLADGKIAAADLELIPVVDSPAEACRLDRRARAGAARSDEHAAREVSRAGLRARAVRAAGRRASGAATVREKPPAEARKRR